MKKNIVCKNNCWSTVLYVTTFLFIFYIMYCSPYISDDYIFLGIAKECSDSINEIIKSALYYGNGRLIGNLLTLLTISIKPLLWIEKTAVLFFIPFLGSKLLIKEDKDKQLLMFVFLTFILVAAPPKIFSEVFTWSSGFNNYVPPILILMVNYYLWQKQSDNRLINILDCSWLFILGFSGQLFVEHNSLINVLIFILLLGISILKRKEKIIKSVLLFCSSFLGLIIMFIIPKIFVNVNKIGGNYRKIYLDNLSETVNNALSNMLIVLNIASQCTVLLAVLGIILLIIAGKNKSAFKNNKLYLISKTGIISFIAFDLIYNLLLKNSEFTKLFLIQMIIVIIAILCFVLSTAIIVISLFKQNGFAFAVVSFILAAFAILPFMFVQPFGNRCIFLSYILICFGSGSLLKNLLNQIPLHQKNQVFVSTVICLASAFICIAMIFTDINWINKQQIKYIEAQVDRGAEQIECSNFYSDYVYSDMWGFPNVYYQKKPYDIKFIPLDFDEWYAKRLDEGWF